jgi:hypothetical protein
MALAPLWIRLEPPRGEDDRRRGDLAFASVAVAVGDTDDRTARIAPELG